MKNKVEKAISRIKLHNMWAPYGAPEDGCNVTFGVEQDYGNDDLCFASYHRRGSMTVYTEILESVEDLADLILRLQPDMRRWRRGNHVWGQR